MNRNLLLAVMVLSLARASAADAQSVDAGARSAARDLAVKGKVLLGEGKHAEALDAFSRADEIMHLPSLGLEAARCLVKLDRWAEASERFRLVARMDYEQAGLNQGQRDVQDQARLDAEREGGELAPKIPSLTIMLAGGASGVALYLDDKPLSAALAGVEFPVDPGMHVVRAERGEWKDSRTAMANAGDKARLEFTVPAPPAPAPIVVLPPPTPPALPALARPPAPPPARRPEAVAHSYEPAPRVAATREAPSSALRAVGWVTAGLGLAGIGVGIATGLVARSQNQQLAKACPNDQCTPVNWSAVDSYNKNKLASTIGFAAGGACLVTGVILVLAAPSGEPPADPKVAFGVGPRSAQVRIRF